MIKARKVSRTTKTVPPAATAALQGAIAVWAAKGFIMVKREVDKNITGRVLKAKPSGPLFRSINLNSKVMPDGFMIGTNLIYGAAWELGFSRKAYDVFPVKAKVLRIPLRDKVGNFTGEVIFRPRAHIPAQTFKAKSFIKSAFDMKQQELRESLESTVAGVVEKTFPHISFELNLEFSRIR